MVVRREGRVTLTPEHLDPHIWINMMHDDHAHASFPLDYRTFITKPLRALEVTGRCKKRHNISPVGIGEKGVRENYRVFARQSAAVSDVRNLEICRSSRRIWTLLEVQIHIPTDKRECFGVYLN
jgi:DNA-binding LytR/AlgR family response regulator